MSTILQACGLSLDYVNTVPIQQKSRTLKLYTYYDYSDWFSEVKTKPLAQRTLKYVSLSFIAICMFYIYTVHQKLIAAMNYSNFKTVGVFFSQILKPFEM